MEAEQALQLVRRTETMLSLYVYKTISDFRGNRELKTSIHASVDEKVDVGWEVPGSSSRSIQLSGKRLLLVLGGVDIFDYGIIDAPS